MGGAPQSMKTNRTKHAKCLLLGALRKTALGQKYCTVVWPRATPSFRRRIAQTCAIYKRLETPNVAVKTTTLSTWSAVYDQREGPQEPVGSERTHDVRILVNVTRAQIGTSLLLRNDRRRNRHVSSSIFPSDVQRELRRR